jgi:DNA-directed RNA polymerase subunit RPC12/RpoP
MSMERCSWCGKDVDTDFNVEGEYHHDDHDGIYYVCEECEE